MTGTVASHSAWKTRSLVWLSVSLGLIVLVAANAHLVYVAVSTQPDCVAHVRHGQGNGTTSFSAATSSCSSKLTKAQVE